MEVVWTSFSTIRACAELYAVVLAPLRILLLHSDSTSFWTLGPVTFVISFVVVTYYSLEL